MSRIKYYIKPNGNSSLNDFVDFAKKNGHGLEISTFSNPIVLDAPNFADIVKEYRKILANFPHLMLHGVYADMYPVSRDQKVVDLCRERMAQNLEVAGKLNAEGVMFHPNYIPLVGEHYSDIDGNSWENRQTEFWETLLPVAKKNNVKIYLENSWEPKPELIKTVIDNLSSKYVRACFDVGHANVYSDIPFNNWMSTLGTYVDYYHISDNRGVKYMDDHWIIGDGMIDWHQFLTQVLSHNRNPRICIEVYKDDLAPTKKSMAYLNNLENSICDG